MSDRLWIAAGALLAALIGGGTANAQAPSAPTDTLPQRLAACTHCHGAQGRAGPDGYYPRLAGKPAAYLYHQLLHFQQGRRSYPLMTHLLKPLDKPYLLAMAEHFAAQSVPYPPPAPVALSAAQMQRAQQLVLEGDRSRQLPACASCHGQALLGALPATPGLLGLPRDYLNAQLGAWRNGLRHAHAPDCMAQIAKALAPEDVAALSGWLASRPVPVGASVASAPARLPMDCGSAP
jgi:cytochrome c553